jgi:uncharacterized membrane protein YidH (DUF202 family)
LTKTGSITREILMLFFTIFNTPSYQSLNTPGMKRTRVVLIWIIGISFIVVGALKYASLEPELKSVFERANYPTWFYYAIGTVELAGGILLLMTAATSKRLGSIIIGLVMLGALVTRFMLDEPPRRFILPGLILLIAVLISFDFEIKNKDAK